MTPEEPLAALINAIETTMDRWGWFGLTLLPLAVAGVAVRQLLPRPVPPAPSPDDPEPATMALWEEFDRVVGRG